MTTFTAPSHFHHGGDASHESDVLLGGVACCCCGRVMVLVCVFWCPAPCGVLLVPLVPPFFALCPTGEHFPDSHAGLLLLRLFDWTVALTLRFASSSTRLLPIRRFGCTSSTLRCDTSSSLRCESRAGLLLLRLFDPTVTLDCSHSTLRLFSSTLDRTVALDCSFFDSSTVRSSTLRLYFFDSSI